MKRIKGAIRNLEPLIDEATNIKIHRGPGRPPELDLKQAKEYSGTKAFVYSFKMMDLDSKMYVAFGMSLRSEKEAFDKAMEMLKHIDIEIESVRFDEPVPRLILSHSPLRGMC